MAAKRVAERVSGVNIIPHFCRIEDKELDFYSDFNIIVLGLDSVEARSYINAVACSFLGACFFFLAWMKNPTFIFFEMMMPIDSFSTRKS